MARTMFIAACLVSTSRPVWCLFLGVDGLLTGASGRVREWIPITSPIWGFPKIRGTFLGVPIIRTIVFWGLYWGPLILGNYHIISISTPKRTYIHFPT